ncbi:MAG TPA: gamma-glutamyl-gamma-aminobutyrate hydrolase family protein, partial [Candidatus Deferrimicrobium sp.]|nr:gamma-glutamyl-gamma-aminobutyrate hydrolase family protein [Candidatus Deferrimicrobium sp.]
GHQMKPVIGITASHIEEEINTYPREYYINAVLRAGGIPILLPIVTEAEIAEHYLTLINGLILSGGSDVGPAHFGQEPVKGTGRVYWERDCFELTLTQRALDLNMPILGICRGAQVLNIAAGGDIYQDIYTQLDGVCEHSQKAERSIPWHTVALLQDSKLGSVFGSGEIRVNSFHHQAIKTVAAGFKIVAKAKDGIIEGIEATKHKFVIGVQWHPEALVKDKASVSLFTALIKASSQYQLQGE